MMETSKTLMAEVLNERLSLTDTELKLPTNQIVNALSTEPTGTKVIWE